MRKLAFALFALLSFGALPSSTPAAAGCHQPSPCAGTVHHYRHSCCNNTGLVYWVQQMAQPSYVAPCCAQPRYHTYAPRHRLHHRPIYRPGYPSVRRMHLHPRPFYRPMRPHLRPYHHTLRAPMVRPHRPHLRPIRVVAPQPKARPVMHKPAAPAKKK